MNRIWPLAAVLLAADAGTSHHPGGAESSHERPGVADKRTRAAVPTPTSSPL